LIDVAGTDATAAYEDVGHSEDADEILQTYLVGTLKDAQTFVKPKTVRLVQQSPPKIEIKNTGGSSLAIKAVSIATGSLGSAFLLYITSRSQPALRDILSKLPRLPLKQLSEIRLPSGGALCGGFSGGFVAATVLCATIGGIVGKKLSKFTQIESGFMKYPPRIKSRNVKKPNPHLAKGFLEPKDYRELPLIRKDQLAPNVYRFVFQLPGPGDVIGLPIGQHVAIKANINGAAVSRSYTPTSNNLDLGRLELVIKCYPDGVLTGQYLANLKVGDKVQFRGPKGAMKYSNGLCKKIGMIAGGTGITPMYQLIRAICEDDTDTTEVSLIYANRSEEDILLRSELEAFARWYPKNFKLWYMLDHPPKNWAYGRGYVTPEVMAAKLPGPAPDTKVMLCGPPGMVNASKKALVAAGFQAPGAVGKMNDQIFCF
jgi:cytochrome-b5 reductase